MITMTMCFMRAVQPDVQGSFATSWRWAFGMLWGSALPWVVLGSQAATVAQLCESHITESGALLAPFESHMCLLCWQPVTIHPHVHLMLSYCCSVCQLIYKPGVWRKEHVGAATSMLHCQGG